LKLSKIWKIKNIKEKDVEEYKKQFNISTMLAKMLIAKDVKKSKVESYLNPTIQSLYDPFLLNDMEKIVERILEAKNKKQKVTIFGDYDVDGITSITILYSFLKDVDVTVEYYLPGRMEEGYGLNKDALKKLKDTGTDLLITVDCGISAIEEAKYAKSIGLDLCITDHHECPEVLPEALAILNPKRIDSKYPFPLLAGVGVAFKLIQALSKALSLDSSAYIKYIDIVAFGTIADIVPLQDENRVITYNGMLKMQSTNNEGLKALIKVAGIEKVESSSVSFALAPRINASGRMADASVAVKLLLSKNELEAYEYAKVLNIQNINRQETERKIYEEAINIINENKLTNNKTIVIYRENWHQGVIGIVASKLAEKYLKPVILLASEKEVIKGSGRTPQGLSIYEALVRCANHLLSFGGHELAAGLSMQKEKKEEFSMAFEEAVTEMTKENFVSIIEIDTEIYKEDINVQIIKDISRIAPFGQKNPVPIFIYKNLKVVEICTLKEGKHLKLRMQDEKVLIDGIAFSAGSRRDDIKIGDKIDLACNIIVNDFRNKKTIQLIVIDFRKSA